MVGTKSPNFKRFSGASYLRYRLVLSTLSATPLRVTRIRADDSSAPGLCASEVSFIRLLDKVTSGATIQINETGTALTYKPGLLIGGDRLSHDCHPSRAMAYYIEPLLMLAPFCKHALNITLRGATHGEGDVCIDSVASVTIPLLRRLTQGNSLSPTVEIKKRAVCPMRRDKDKKNSGGGSGSGPGNGGVVVLRCDVITGKLGAVDLINNGVVKRVRGVAFGNRVAPGHLTRMIDSTRGVFNKFSPDVYIHSDHNNEDKCGRGFGIHLVAETTQGCLLGADWTCMNPDVTPEQTARAACAMLLDEVEHGGCVDSNNIPLAIVLAAVSEPDLSRLRIGRLGEPAIVLLRDVEAFLGVRFNMRVLGGAVREERWSDDSDYESESDSDDGDGTQEKDVQDYGIVMSCLGAGIGNVARTRF